MGSFECACDELSEEVLEAAKSFKFGNEDIQEGGAFIVSVGVKISPAHPHLLIRCSTCSVSISMGGCSLFDQTRALPALAHTVSLGWSWRVRLRAE